MSTLNLDEIRARADAATPGPWRPDNSEVYTDDLHSIADDRDWVAETLKDDDPMATRADAEFIAHARQDIPALLVEVERLTAARDRYVADVAHLREQLRGANVTLAEIEEVGPRCEHC